jgi:hypothetical protein
MTEVEAPSRRLGISAGDEGELTKSVVRLFAVARHYDGLGPETTHSVGVRVDENSEVSEIVQTVYEDLH